jgi:hypothetical protein
MRSRKSLSGKKNFLNNRDGEGRGLKTVSERFTGSPFSIRKKRGSSFLPIDVVLVN